MVVRERIVQDFIDLVKVDSPSLRERQMADAVKAKLAEIGVDYREDDAGARCGGNTGNIICTLKGDSSKPSVLVLAHMDTVVPLTGKKPIIDGDIIRSDGTTILGGDDAAGMVSMLEAIRQLKDRPLTQGDIHFVFTICEEAGMHGAKNLDTSVLAAKYGFVMDHASNVGAIVVKTPSRNDMTITIKGKATHAGKEPEKGINAIQIASEAIAAMRLGRIDHETTANVGIIQGGLMGTIVCDQVEIVAEARSANEEKLAAQTAHMEACFKQAAYKYGGSAEIRCERIYSAFDVSSHEGILSIMREATGRLGLELVPEATGSGSDTNILNSQGIVSVAIGCGMREIHSVEEWIDIKDMVKATELLLQVLDIEK